MDERHFKSLQKQLRIVAIIIILLLVAIIAIDFLKKAPVKQTTDEDLKKFILSMSDTLVTDKQHIEMLQKALITNKIMEDSLQNAIDNAMDSIEILEKKMLFMQENANVSIDIIIGIADSIDVYRKQTQKLKEEIERINHETEILLKKERDNNERLRQKLNEYEQRLLALFAINIETIVYSDGYDENYRLTTTDKAKKVQEIVVTFHLSRDVNKDDEITIELCKDSTTIYTITKVKAYNRSAKRSFKIPSSAKLESGNYSIMIYHENEKHGIERTEIGKDVFELN